MRIGYIFYIFMILFVASALGTTLSCAQRQEYQFDGRTMGTTYQVKVLAKASAEIVSLKADVDRILDQINQSMSTFNPSSEISRFNALKDTQQKVYISGHFQQVLLNAQKTYNLTRGAWDGTINPLVELWGFGKSKAPHQVPSSEVINREMQKIGFDQIEIGETGYLRKKNPNVTLDLASIAKGYAVDQVALLLKQKLYRDFLVEIGGELYASGGRKDGKAWKVGINRPAKYAAPDEIYKILILQDQAMATSGDYRNFYIIGGHPYSHIIDPRNGHPISNGVVSVSVIADGCAFADGLATGIMVMGPEKGIALLDTLEQVEGLIVVRHKDGRLVNFMSNGAGEIFQ
ncbi:MAG: FAD:protein FMN transferase [Desulfobacteraceae bacterium]|nr:FAD:protein FMN transferase [Desulfobacteraceae bacterium]